MRKSELFLFALALSLTVSAGCASGTKPVTITAPGDSSSSGPAKAPATGDDTIAPKAETPPPVVSPDPSTPPALPTPPKAPETPPPPEGSKSAEAAPETPVIKYIAPREPISILLAPRKPAVSLTEIHTVACKDCSAGGSDHELRCPSNYVVTGFRFGTDDFLGAPVIGGIEIVCSHLDQDHVHADDIALAQYFESDPVTGALRAVTHAGKAYDLESAVNCPIEDGIATGVIGRSGSRLDSFGLTCGLYLNNDTFTGVFPAAKETLTGDKSVYGGMPGDGGEAFDASCDVNEAIVGLNISSVPEDAVYGINSLTCAKVARADSK